MKKFIQSAALLLLFSILNSQLTTAQAQGTAFTYQGRVTDNGANFTGAGLFKFALVTSTNVNAQQATATASPPNSGFITVITVTFGGSGYVTAPAVTITGGGGSGCMATAQISAGGVVTNIIVNNSGSGYTSTPTVTVAAPPANIVYTTWWSNDGTSTGGSQPASAVSVGVANGLFTVVLGNTNLPDMTAIPASIFSAQPGLQLMMWFNDGTNGFAMVNPVQTLTPTPYAIFAASANTVSGVVPSGGLSGSYSGAVSFTNTGSSFTGDGSGLFNVNAATLGGLASSNFWQLGGNTVSAGQFLGSMNNQPVAILVNNLQVMQFTYASNSMDGYSPNVIGGYGGNNVAGGVVGATIGGGGSATAFNPNMILDDFGTVVGGSVCVASKYAVAGGYYATAGGQYSVAFGKQPTATGYASTALGAGYASGTNSTALGDSSAVGDYSTAMGYLSSAYGYASTAMGHSTASGAYSTAMGYSTATNRYATAMGKSTAGGPSSTAMGYSTASGDTSTAMGVSTASGDTSTAMGYSTASGNYSTAMGVSRAYVSGSTAMGYSTAGGTNSTALGASIATNSYATAMGASSAGGQDSTAMGNSTANGFVSTAMGYGTANGQYSTAMGNSTANGSGATAMGASSAGGFISTAMGNSAASGDYSFAAGREAVANYQGDFVWADSQGNSFNSTANDQFLIRAQGGVGIGTAAPETALHIANPSGITIGQSATGGGYTALNIDLSAVSGGYAELQAISSAGTSYGNLILQNHAGNVGIGKNNPASKLDVNGVVSATSFNSTSDRNAKENFAPVDARDVLDRVAALPITRWNFKTDTNTAHLGPMAQDFHAAFGLGTDDKHIATVDEEGVALAAIQGLNEKLETQLKEKDAEIAGLQARLEKIEQLISSTKGNSK